MIFSWGPEMREKHEEGTEKSIFAFRTYGIKNRAHSKDNNEVRQ